MFGTLRDMRAAVEPSRAASAEDAERLGGFRRRKQRELDPLHGSMEVFGDVRALAADALARAPLVEGVAEPGLAPASLGAPLRLPASVDAAATLDTPRAGGQRLASLGDGDAPPRTALGSAGPLDRSEFVLSAEPARIARVSAGPRDTRAAARRGFRSIRVDRSDLPDEPSRRCPAHRVGALADLPPSSLR